MTKKKKSAKQKSFSELLGLNYIINERANTLYGLMLFGLALFLIFAFWSYFSTAADDQSLVLDLRNGDMANKSRQFHNICTSSGAVISDFFIARCFGIPAFLIPFFLILWSLHCFRAYQLNLWKWFLGLTVVMLWSSVTLAKILSPMMTDQVFNPGGGHGAWVCDVLERVIGEPGLVIVLAFVAIAFLTFVTQETIVVIRKVLNPKEYIKRVKWTITNDEPKADDEPEKEEDSAELYPQDEPAEPASAEETAPEPEEAEDATPLSPIVDTPEPAQESAPTDAPAADPDFTIDEGVETERASGKTVTHYDISTPINPHEPWTHYKYPTLDLLKHYDSDDHTFIDKDEVEKKKNRIIEVLHDFGVDIRTIRATVGPTITLYEITPAQGVRISKIKNLEDDIALSLAATGIRIIAPMPGKGTIGIEVPNDNPQIVSMLSILNSKKFQTAKMELPIALGKTITNDVFMADLAKIPHLLVAGATGQGKSVGLNAIITSLLYKKHPNELKIVLVDPKKVEFSVYAPIADHFMAAVEENADEPIITDVQKVVKTLKGLCVLMDRRYDLLKRAAVRNIKEYNQKFLEHKLNPQDGHEFMPYIVIVIDEFGDLILTAGRDVEQPITRIAQLARAVGMHMIIATQRPTTSIITGNIKANFPGRIAFRVGAMVDSRTIIDRSGAQQLVGRGDMLYLGGAEPVRVQCAFVDTPEVERISRYIADQSGPLEPLEIPEPVAEGADGEGGAMAVGDMDSLFAECARLVVTSRSGSTSMIQRHFSIGYNRAGRIMDQLEHAGIVGPAQGAKPREVLIQDEMRLTELLQSMNG